jgi:hypothetical protein
VDSGNFRPTHLDLKVVHVFNPLSTTWVHASLPTSKAGQVWSTVYYMGTCTSYYKSGGTGLIHCLLHEPLLDSLGMFNPLSMTQLVKHGPPSSTTVFHRSVGHDLFEIFCTRSWSPDETKLLGGSPCFTNCVILHVPLSTMSTSYLQGGHGMFPKVDWMFPEVDWSVP